MCGNVAFLMHFVLLNGDDFCGVEGGAGFEGADAEGVFFFHGPELEGEV